MVPAPFTLLEKRQDTEDTWTLELEARSGEPFEFAPGQFTMLSAGGAGEVPISISGDPDEPERLVHTVRAVGLATQAICDAEPGHALGARTVRLAWPVEEAEGMTLLSLPAASGCRRCAPRSCGCSLAASATGG